MSKVNNDGRYDSADSAAIEARATAIENKTTKQALAAAVNVTGFVAGSGTAAKSDSVWAGVAGASAFSVGDIVTALKAAGILAA